MGYKVHVVLSCRWSYVLKPAPLVQLSQKLVNFYNIIVAKCKIFKMLFVGNEEPID